MKCQFLCSRSGLVGAVVFFLLPILTGCAELYVTAHHDQTWVVENATLLISCEGWETGTDFATEGYCLGAGHCYMPLLGANPLETAYWCRFISVGVDSCCGETVIDLTTPTIYPVNLGCGTYDSCDYGY